MNKQKRFKTYAGCMCGIVAIATLALPLVAKSQEPETASLTSTQYNNGRLPGDDVKAKEPIIIAYDENGDEYVEDYENYNIEQALIEQGYYRDDIPLSYENQDYLQTACNEFDIEYALALGVIERETDFQNIMGDNGNSYGYMQVYKYWHEDRMVTLGVDDLMNPFGNFRVGCSFLKECIDKYGLESGLAYYNSGSTKINNYVGEVLCNMEKWQNVLDS